MKSENDIFCLDANILITLHRFYPITLVPSLWKKLDNIFKSEQVISHKFVFEEICYNKKKLDDLGKWITKWERCFKGVSPKQFQLISEVLSHFPKLIDASRTKNQADPWLLTMILEEKTMLQNVEKRFIMVSNENPNSPDKIPAACKFFNIEHLNFHEFITYNEWRFEVT